MTKMTVSFWMTILIIGSNCCSSIAGDFFFGDNSDCRITIRAACISNGFSEDKVRSQTEYMQSLFEKDNPNQATITRENTETISGYNCNKIPSGPNTPPAIIQLLIREFSGSNYLCLQYWTKATSTDPLEREDLTHVVDAFNANNSYKLRALDDGLTICETHKDAFGLFSIFKSKELGGKKFYKCVKDDPRYATKPQNSLPPTSRR